MDQFSIDLGYAVISPFYNGSLSLVSERICLEGTFGFVFDFDSIQEFMDQAVCESLITKKILVVKI